MSSIANGIALRLSRASAVVTGQNGLTMGLIILLVIEAPVVILILASFLGKPRRLKVTGLFLGWLLLMFGAFLGAVYFLGLVLGFFF
jgi:hypothetical protein